MNNRFNKLGTWIKETFFGKAKLDERKPQASPVASGPPAAHVKYRRRKRATKATTRPKPIRKARSRMRNAMAKESRRVNRGQA